MKRATVTITVDYEDGTPDEWISSAAEDALVQLREARHVDVSGEEDVETEFYSTAHRMTVAVEDLAVVGTPLNAQDREYLATQYGVFEDGYDPEAINRVLTRITGADLYCLWGHIDQWGLGGDSELVGRLAGGHTWYPVNPELWAYLTGDGPLTLPEGTALLATAEHDAQNLDQESPYRYGRNLARADKNSADQPGGTS